MKVKNTLEEIHRLAKETGYWPSISEWDKYAQENGFLTVMGLYYHLRKPWEKLREDAGFPQRTKELTKEEAIEYLRLASQDLGINFTRKAYIEWREKNPGSPAPGRIARLFGGWATAMEAAGLIPGPYVTKHWSDEELLNILLQAAYDMGKDLSENDYEKWRASRKEATPSVETIRMRFQGWNVVKEMLELETFPPGPYASYRWYRGEWLPVLVRFIEEQLSSSAYEKWASENDAPAIKTIREYAGNWSDALFMALDIYIERKERMSDNG